MSKELKEKIVELETELRAKQVEVMQYRRELSRANETIEKVVAQLEQEIKYAALIQKALSPTEIPSIPGVEFSTKFVAGSLKGGDYFDIFEHEDKLKFGILLACSSGYTMSALFLSVLLRFSGQLEARRGMDPAELVSLMAKELTPQIQNQDTASLFYGVIDRRNYELKYCLAGGLPAFLHSREGSGSLSVLEPSSGPFSKEYRGGLLTHTLSLAPRDRLVLCSEGLLMNSSREREWERRENWAPLISQSKLKTVHDVRNEILFQLEKNAGSIIPERDVTVVVTEVKDRVIKLAKK